MPTALARNRKALINLQISQSAASSLQQQKAEASQIAATWPFVVSGIATFVLQYAASGALETPLQQPQLAGLPLLDVLLASTALLHWYSFERTLQGA